jgi:hypothetical protein
MTVSLEIKWPDGNAESVPLGVFKLVDTVWQPIAERLDLKLVPIFSRALGLVPSRIQPLLDELTIFRTELVSLGSDYEASICRVDRLVEALHRLKQADGWTASIG